MFGAFKKKNRFLQPKAVVKKKEKKEVDIPKTVKQVKRQIKKRRQTHKVRKIKEAVDQNYNQRRFIYKKRFPRLYRKQQRVIDRRKVLRDWFDLLDTDGSGEIDVGELANPLVSLGFARNVADVMRIIEAVDDDGSGTLGVDEFIQIVEGGTSREKGKSNGKQAVLQLLDALKSGDIGDVKNLNLDTIISNYKRKRMMEGLLAYGRSDIDPSVKTRDRQALSALAAMREMEADPTMALKRNTSLYILNDVNPNDEAVKEQERIMQRRLKLAERKCKPAKYSIPVVKTLCSSPKTVDLKGHFFPDVTSYKSHLTLTTETKAAADKLMNRRP